MEEIANNSPIYIWDGHGGPDVPKDESILSKDHIDFLIRTPKLHEFETDPEEL